METKSKLFLLGLGVRRALLGGHSERSISSLVAQVCPCVQMKYTYPLPALDGGVTGGICVTSSTLILHLSLDFGPSWSDLDKTSLRGPPGCLTYIISPVEAWPTCKADFTILEEFNMKYMKGTLTSWDLFF